MTHQNHQTNGASLEDCHTNFFALVSNFYIDERSRPEYFYFEIITIVARRLPEVAYVRRALRCSILGYRRSISEQFPSGRQSRHAKMTLLPYALVLVNQSISIRVHLHFQK